MEPPVKDICSTSGPISGSMAAGVEEKAGGRFRVQGLGFRVKGSGFRV